MSLTKVGEGLADTQLVLAWLLDAIGAPTWAIGLLVPVRESLAMLPQLLIAARIRRFGIRKHVYVTGCVVQGAAIAGIELQFVVMVAHQGVRLGRSVHLVDMADLDTRAAYTALSNSVVGLILLVGGVFGIIAQWFGIGTVLVLFALLAALAIPTASRLEEVQLPTGLR